jgi:biotin carboxyl carrier protein
VKRLFKGEASRLTGYGMIFLFTKIHEMRTIIFYIILFLIFIAVVVGEVYFHIIVKDEHDQDHDRDHGSVVADVGEVDTIILNRQALLNSGIDEQSIVKVTVGTFSKELTIPAMVIDRSGKSVIKIPSPMSGVVSKIFVEPNSTVQAETPLFELTLTTPELAKAQTELIDFVQRIENIEAEYQRYLKIGEEVAPQEIRKLSYQKKELDASIANHRNLLRLLGLSENDIIDTISRKCQIIKTMLVKVPQSVTPLQLNEVFIELGQQVQQGTTLCNLGDLSELFIEGKVFAFNEELVTKALIEKNPVSASFDGNCTITDLRLRSVDNRIDPQTRTLSCLVEFRNKILADKTIQTNGSPQRFITWQFKTGQRCELNIGYETIDDCIVLPVDAIAKELREASVFEWVGEDGGQKVWRKCPVRLLYQTKSQAVIANDGSILPNAQIAGRGATFLLNALNAQRLKPKSASGSVDHGDHVH